MWMSINHPYYQNTPIQWRLPIKKISHSLQIASVLSSTDYMLHECYKFSSFFFLTRQMFLFKENNPNSYIKKRETSHLVGIVLSTLRFCNEAFFDPPTNGNASMISINHVKPLSRTPTVLAPAALLLFSADRFFFCCRLYPFAINFQKKWGITSSSNWSGVSLATLAATFATV